MSAPVPLDLSLLVKRETLVLMDLAMRDMKDLVSVLTTELWNAENQCHCEMPNGAHTIGCRRISRSVRRINRRLEALNQGRQ